MKLKLAAFPFQKYGMVEGTVEHVSADAADVRQPRGRAWKGTAGRRSVLEYLLSPVRKAWHEAGRER